MSKHSLPNRVALLALLFALVDAASASAQTRTPTSPLDTQAEPPRTNPDVPRVDTNTGSTPVPQRPELRVNLPEAGRVRATAPIELSQLLPEGVSTGAGLTPDEVVRRATELSLNARRAHARTESSEAAVRVARRGFIPTATAGARYTRLSSYTPGSIPTFNTRGCIDNLVDCQANPEAYELNAVLQQPILDQYALTANISVPISNYLGAQRHELEAARLERDAAVESERGSRNDAVLTGLETYFELVRARAQLRLADEAANAAEQRARDARARLGNGLVTESVVLDAEANAQSYTQLRAVADSRAVIAERALRDLLELPDDAEIALAVELSALPTNDDRSAETLRAEAQTNDPTARASILRAEALYARADAERGRMFPTLSVAFNYTYANPNQRIFPQTTTFTGTWDFGAQLTFSLDGTMLAGARRSQRLALAAESELAAEDDTRRAGRTVLEARGQLVASLAEVEARRLATASASIRERDTNARQGVGLSTDSDVLDASAGALRARLDLVDAVVNAHLAQARLTRALGTSNAP